MSIIISFYIYNIIRVRLFSRGGFNVLHFLSEQNNFAEIKCAWTIFNEKYSVSPRKYKLK